MCCSMDREVETENYHLMKRGSNQMFMMNVRRLPIEKRIINRVVYLLLVMARRGGILGIIELESASCFLK